LEFFPGNFSGIKDLAQDVAEDVLGAAKDGSDSAQDVAVDVLGGSIRREGFYLAHRQGKSRTCCIIPRLSLVDTDLTRNTRAPHFTPQHWLLCHMGLY